jgi:hypothetical protein
LYVWLILLEVVPSWLGKVVVFKILNLIFGLKIILKLLNVLNSLCSRDVVVFVWLILIVEKVNVFSLIV